MPPDTEAPPLKKDRSSPLMASLAPALRRTAALFSGQGAREGYLAAIDQGAISLANFLATVLLARAISPTELGIYGVGFTSLRLVRSVQEGLVIQPMNTIGAAMETPHFNRYATHTSLLQILLAILSSAAVALGGWLLTRLGNDTAGPALASLWFVFLWWQLQEYIRRMLYTRGDVFNAVVNTLLANGIRLGIMILWAKQGRLSGVAGLDAIAWGSLAALLPGLWQTRSHWAWPAPGWRESWLHNWEFGRWVLGGTLANWLSVEFYPVLTAGMISFAAAGAYRAIQNLVAPIHLLLRATDTFLTPRAARLYSEKGRDALSRTLRLTYLVSGIPILGMLAVALLFPEPLLHFLYGDTYLPFSSAVIWMAAFYALWFAYWPLQTALKAMRLSRPIFIANLAATVAMLTAGIWAIYRWGVYGTIAGQALNAFLVAVILWQAWLSLRRKQAAE